jgi:hypothetical protein
MNEPSKDRVVELIAETRHRIVGMTEFKGMLILATERGVYRYEHQQFVPIKFTDESEIPDAKPE